MDEKEEEKPKSKLSEDVIYGIAEQMFFKIPFSKNYLREIDLTKQNPYTIFMGHCQMHLNAMMAQFAKLKGIEFIGCNDEKDEILFYKHKDFDFSNRDGKDAFSGPYRVTKPMAFGVVEYGKLRVSAVRTTNYLKKVEKTVSTTDDDDVHAAKKKPIEAFAALFLDHNMSEEEIANNSDELNIEHLRVFEPPDVIEANIMSLLALNSAEIELNSDGGFRGKISPYSDSIFFGGSSNQSSKNTSFANKTQKITVGFAILLDFPIEDFAPFGLKWQRQVHFLIQSCPNMEQLHFHLVIYFTDDFLPEQILQQIRAILNAIRQLLEQMDGGSEKLRVCVDFTSTCEEPGSVESIMALDNGTDGEQQLFNSLEIVDARGRPHLCEFTV